MSQVFPLSDGRTRWTPSDVTEVTRQFPFSAQNGFEVDDAGDIHVIYQNGVEEIRTVPANSRIYINVQYIKATSTTSTKIFIHTKGQ